MKRFLCLMLCALCLFAYPLSAYGSEADASADYNTAGKLQKQLWAGSGFSGTLTVKIAANAGRAGESVTTQKPMSFNVDYIYVRPTDTATAAHRLDLSLMEGETAQTAAHLCFQDGALSAQADIVGAEWYTLGGGQSVRASSDSEQESGALGSVQGAATNLLAQTGMPALLTYVLPMALRLQEQKDALADVISAYVTRIDLWIEGYRQNATLDKLEDGTTTMTVQYTIPPTAIKSQAKQLVLDLLSDSATLAKLQTLLSTQDASLLLNPRLRTYYFQSIEDLPIPSDLTIERTVDLKGNTLALHVLLPMYDAEGGAFTVKYDRVKGETDLPDENVVTLTGTQRASTLSYQSYNSLDGVTVYQGTFTSQATGAIGFAVGENDETTDAPQQALAVAFTLTSKGVEGRDEEDRDVYDYDLSLALSPDDAQSVTGETVAFEPTTIALTAHFASKTLKTATTEMDATLTIGGDESASIFTAQLVGKTRKKWDPTPLPATLVDVRDMTDSEVNALLPGVLTRGGALLLGYFDLPNADASATQTPAAGTPTPEVFETIAPEATVQ